MTTVECWCVGMQRMWAMDGREHETCSLRLPGLIFIIVSGILTLSYVILAEIVNVIIFCHNYYQSIIIIIIIIIVTIGRWNLARSIPAIGIIGLIIVDICWSFLSNLLGSCNVHHIMEKHNQCFFVLSQTSLMFIIITYSHIYTAQWQVM